MLQEIQNMPAPSMSPQPRKRTLPKPCAALTDSSTTAELVSWLATILRPNEMRSLNIKGFGASDLLMLETEQEVAAMLGLKTKVALKVKLRLDELRATKRMKSEPGWEQDAENMKPVAPIERKPDPQQLAVKQEPAVDAQMQEDAGLHAVLNEDEDTQEAAHEEDAHPQQHANIPEQEDAEVEETGGQDDMEESDDELAHNYNQAVENGEAAADADLPWCPLVPPEPVVLPEDKAEANTYVQRTLLGFVGLMADMHPACMSNVAGKYNVRDSGKSGVKMTKKQKGYTREKQLFAVWKEVTEAVKGSFESGSNWKVSVERDVFTLKKNLHEVLDSAAVQNFHTTCRALRKHVPYAYDVEPQPEQEDDAQNAEQEDKQDKAKEKRKVVADELLLERAWSLWQATPLICSMDVPMHVKVPANVNYLTKASKTKRGCGQPQHFWFGKMWDSATSEDNQLKVQAPTVGDKVVESQAALEILNKVSKVRYGTSWSQAGILPFVHFERNEELDVQNLYGYTLRCRFFLEGAQATMEASDGMSGFCQFDETLQSVQLVDLFRYGREFQDTELQQMCEQYATRFTEVSAQVAEIAEDRNIPDASTACAQPVDGRMFKGLLGLVSDTVSSVPEGLNENLKPLLTVTPKRYQLSSIGFVQREESAASGLQRHYVWPVTLPHHPEVTTYLIPHSNSLWWASSKDLLYPEEHAPGVGICAMRKPKNIELTGTESKGGLLGLQMGMGKTLVMIAAHALEQHTLPEKPVMHTDWTDAELQEYEEVLVGKDVETAKEHEMFKGFKLDDDAGTIVPDGSLRFTGLGNLVIVPTSIAPQWQQEIEKLCTQPQNIIVLDGLKDRRRFMTTKEGLEELASFDWVVTTPAKAAKDIDMLNAITWRRVIADEAHQIQASRGVPMPEVPVSGVTKRGQREMAFMSLLGKVPAAAGYWCLTGTPLKDYRNVASMDRIFSFLSTGVRTSDLHTSGFVNFMMDIAIRFSKDGTVKVADRHGKVEIRNMRLPPVNYEMRLVNLNEADEALLQMVKTKLIISSGYTVEAILEKQKEKDVHQGDVDLHDVDEEEDDDGDDEDYEQPLSAEEKKRMVQKRKDERAERKRKVMQDQDQDAASKKKKDTMAVQVLSKIVDPLRKVLSCAQELYFEGTVEGPKLLEPSAETLHIGEPEELKKMKLRKQRGQEPPTPQEYAEARCRIAEKREREYTAVNLSSKVDVLIADVENIMEDGPDKDGRQPKVIIYSNFAASFGRIKTYLDMKNIRYASLVESSMSMKKRALAMEEFREDPDVPVFLLNKALGATGINLTVANHVLILEPSWNPVFEDQAISRAHRLGQTGPIQVVRYIANDTVDKYLRDLMLQAASEDDGVQDMLMDAVEQKGTFESDEKALNNTIGKKMDLPSLCALIGDIDVSDSEDDEEFA